MFGLKVIKNSEYADLLQSYQDEHCKSERLALENAALKVEIETLKDSIAKLKEKNEVKLIEDVAEAPLVEKPVKKVIRKTSSGKTTRKRVVKKAESEKSQE